MADLVGTRCCRNTRFLARNAVAMNAVFMSSLVEFLPAPFSGGILQAVLLLLCCCPDAFAKDSCHFPWENFRWIASGQSVPSSANVSLAAADGNE